MKPATLKALGPLAGGLFGLIDDLFTSDEEKSEAKLKVMTLLSTEKVAQMAVNAKEAEHKSMFVAGWRPAVGWICALALLWQFVALPILSALILTIAAYTGVPIDLSGLLQFNMYELMPILAGMLGLGTLRTVEKRAGVHSNNLTS